MFVVLYKVNFKNHFPKLRYMDLKKICKGLATLIYDCNKHDSLYNFCKISYQIGYKQVQISGLFNILFMMSQLLWEDIFHHLFFKHINLSFLATLKAFFRGMLYFVAANTFFLGTFMWIQKIVDNSKWVKFCACFMFIIFSINEITRMTFVIFSKCWVYIALWTFWDLFRSWIALVIYFISLTGRRLWWSLLFQFPFPFITKFLQVIAWHACLHKIWHYFLPLWHVWGNGNIYLLATFVCFCI